MIRQNQERLVAEDGLVAIFRARSGDEDDGGHGRRGARQRERARERDAGSLVLVGDLLFEIRIRLDRDLRPFGCRDGHLSAFEHERSRHASLRPRAVDGRPVRGQRAFEDGRGGLHFEFDGTVRNGHRVEREAHRSLVDAVERRGQLAVGGLHMKRETQVGAAHG